MVHLIDAADRAAFKRCRRQWDFSAATRRGLQPLRADAVDLDRAVRDALAVYYFPGMWDWDSAIVLPLVVKALADSLTRQRAAVAGRDPLSDEDDALWRAALVQGRLLLERYFAWAPAVDRFSPVRVEVDFDAIVPDPNHLDAGLLAPDGEEFRYTGRIALLALDEHDRYWVVNHRVRDGRLPPTEQLLLDEESVAACWAWGVFYDGMEVAGTIHNELVSSVPDMGSGAALLSASAAYHPRGGIPQNEASGGGRSVSSPRRMYIKGRSAEVTERTRQSEGDGFRRTAIRRDPAEIRVAGMRLAQEAADMIGAGTRNYPNPSVEHCPSCAFVPPCLAVDEGVDAEALLAASYRRRPAGAGDVGRLGGTPYGVGRGWVLDSEVKRAPPAGTGD